MGRSMVEVALLFSVAVGACSPARTTAPSSAAAGVATVPPALAMRDVCKAASVRYVTVVPETSNDSGRSSVDIERLVRDPVVRTLSSANGVVVASGEHREGRCELSVGVGLGPQQRGDGSTRVTVVLGVFFRSDRHLLGFVRANFVTRGGSTANAPSEDDVIHRGAEMLAAKLAAHLPELTAAPPGEGEAARELTDPSDAGINPDRAIVAMRDSFRECYQAGLRLDPTLAGRVVIEAKVRETGEVESTTIVSRVGLSPAVADCIAGVIERGRFTASTRSSVVSIPVRFENEQRDQARRP